MTSTDPSTPQRKRWTRKEYYRLSERGFFLKERVELVDGDIVLRLRQTNCHSVILALAFEALDVAFGHDVWIRLQIPLDLSDWSVPDPDVAVIPGSPRSYRGKKENPTTALLVVEVSETTLNLDRRFHGSLYASAGIAEYWIINMADGQLEVYRDPVPDAGKLFGHGYATRTDFGPMDKVSPLAAPNAQILVGDLLP